MHRQTVYLVEAPSALATRSDLPDLDTRRHRRRFVQPLRRGLAANALLARLYY